MRELALALPSTSSGSGSSSSAGGDAEERGEYEEEDSCSSLLGCDLMTEPSGGSIPSSATAAAAARTAGCSSGALQPDLCRLAGSVAAAGVLLPQPPLPGAGASSGSSGSASSGEGGAGWGATAPAAAPQPGSPRGQLAAALERQRSLLACDDIGCLAAVTFAFQHQPGKPSCPAAWRQHPACASPLPAPCRLPMLSLLCPCTTPSQRRLCLPPVTCCDLPCRVAGGGGSPHFAGPHLWAHSWRRLRLYCAAAGSSQTSHR
jgi:hypothetical protein